MKLVSGCRVGGCERGNRDLGVGGVAFWRVVR